MRIVQLVSVAVLSCVAFSANASDNSNKKPAQIVAKQSASLKHDWSGFNIGVNLGYGQVNDRAEDLGNASIDDLECFYDCLSLSVIGRGVIGGLSAGYDLQLGNFVIGAGGDFSLAVVSASATQVVADYSVMHEVRMSNLSTIRARIGFVANDTNLFYLTGGVAAADIGNKWLDIVSQEFSELQFSETKLRYGYTFGGGTEYSLSKNWSMKAEGLYYNFPDTTLTSYVFESNSAYIKFKNDGFIAQAGLNYHF